MLGEYIFFCLVFVVLALLEFALIIILNRMSGDKKNQENREPRLLNQENNSELTSLGVGKISFLEDHSKDIYSNNAGQERKNRTKSSLECMPSIQPIHAMDLAAAVIFPLAFIMYNGLYWIRNSNDGELNC